MDVITLNGEKEIGKVFDNLWENGFIDAFLYRNEKRVGLIMAYSEEEGNHIFNVRLPSKDEIVTDPVPNTSVRFTTLPYDGFIKVELIENNQPTKDKDTEKEAA